jgi:ferric-dicitrate binding protein FerR (iron transport regulator)
VNQRKRQAAALEAAHWLVQLNVAYMPSHDRARYLAWLKTSPVHVAEMLRVIRVHEALHAIFSVQPRPKDAD